MFHWMVSLTLKIKTIDLKTIRKYLHNIGIPTDLKLNKNKKSLQPN